MFMAPGRRPDDGQLDVVLSAATSKAHFLRVLPRVFKGTHVERPGVARPARRARCASTPTARSRVYADGDPIGELPVTVRAIPARCGCCCRHERLSEARSRAAVGRGVAR